MALAPLGIHALRDIRQECFEGIQGLLAGDPFARRLHRESFRVHGDSHQAGGSGVGCGSAVAASNAKRPASSASARTVAGVSGFNFGARFLIAVLTIMLSA